MELRSHIRTGSAHVVWITLRSLRNRLDRCAPPSSQTTQTLFYWVRDRAHPAKRSAVNLDDLRCRPSRRSQRLVGANDTELGIGNRTIGPTVEGQGSACRS